jgi:short subunit dehydrogenase-like uncharacterized protein
MERSYDLVLFGATGLRKRLGRPDWGSLVAACAVAGSDHVDAGGAWRRR